ncbi:MAG: DUF58 domain-containing protein [Planctomycetes bacterium]|nr:DUF58 domain-containing protein [Planctomycetota bacterium]
MRAARKYLDPVLLSKLGNMELVARCVMEGFYTGLHPSPFHGFSVEYSDHRPYQPGDELRYLDWKVLGRSDKLYIKQFHQETNLSAYILLDSSKSMSFAGEGAVSKVDYGSFLCAGLAYLMLRQGDRVGLTLFSDRITNWIPARSTRAHLHTILAALQHNEVSGKTNIADTLHSVADMAHQRGLFIVISDLIDDVEELYNGLAHLSYLRHDVVLFHVLDHQELALDYEGLIEFEDVESGSRIRTFPQSLRDSYRQRVQRFVDDVARTAGEHRIDYCLLDTSEPLDRALIVYLAKRKALM